MVLTKILGLLCVVLVASCAALPVKEYDRATELKGKVQKYELGVYAPENYQKSESLYNDGVSNYNKDNGKAKISLDNAITNYQMVLEEGFSKKVQIETLETLSNKNDALAYKADKFSGSDFEQADQLYQQGLTDAQNKNYEDALTKIASAKEQFQRIYKQAKEKKENGQLLIRQVKQKLDDVDKSAEKIQKEKTSSEKLESTLQSGNSSNN